MLGKPNGPNYSQELLNVFSLLVVCDVLHKTVRAEIGGSTEKYYWFDLGKLWLATTVLSYPL